MQTEQRSLPFAEFVALAAVMTSLVALSIDAMLPALPEIGSELAVEHPNDAQLVVSILFLGLAAGQMLYGPLSDSIGRKRAIYAGLVLFEAGCLMSLLASSFEVMLWGRALQGFGVAAPRVVMLALVRDLYVGRAMARVMSFVMSIFILVPAMAPALGQGIIAIAHWRAIFAVFALQAALLLVWFALRQPETLAPERRVPFSAGRLSRAVAEVCTSRVALGYALTAGLVFGAFIGYLSSAQQVLQQQYGLGVRFPLYFAILALAIGGASILNARLVVRKGMRWMTFWALVASSGLSAVFLGIAGATQGHPALGWFMGYMMATLFCSGITFANLNALAMEPLGRIAGVGAAVVGGLSTLVSVPLGVLIGAAYDGTVMPLVAGFATLSIAALATVTWTEHGINLAR